jgi:hypothetical protein
MYTGTLIDDLMAAVERAEEHVQLAARVSLSPLSPQKDPACVLMPALYNVTQIDQNLLGAA